MSCANTEGILRVIQSIPSSKAEPFKRWLAQVGNERILEINDPELAMQRMRSLHEAKGYPLEYGITAILTPAIKMAPAVGLEPRFCKRNHRKRRTYRKPYE